MTTEPATFPCVMSGERETLTVRPIGSRGVSFDYGVEVSVIVAGEDLLRIRAIIDAQTAVLSAPQPQQGTAAEPWDGIPLNPDVDGWHWLMSNGHECPYPMRWASAGWWMGLADGSVSIVKERWRYLAPCPLPAFPGCVHSFGEGATNG